LISLQEDEEFYRLLTGLSVLYGDRFEHLGVDITSYVQVPASCCNRFNQHCVLPRPPKAYHVRRSVLLANRNS